MGTDEKMQNTSKLEITEKATRIFKDSTADPYLRIGARKGGCSGWTFTLDSDTEVDSTDSLFEEFLLINTEIHETIIGDLEVDYRDDNIVEQGFIFKRLGSGQLCGCGESFTPLGSDKALGW